MDGLICHICMTPLAYHQKGQNCVMEAQASQTAPTTPAQVRRYSLSFDYEDGWGFYLGAPDKDLSSLDVVHADDYDRLQSQLTAAQQAVAEREARIKELLDVFEDLFIEWSRLPQKIDQRLLERCNAVFSKEQTEEAVPAVGNARARLRDFERAEALRASLALATETLELARAVLAALKEA
jgi:hypothetical protein